MKKVYFAIISAAVFLCIPSPRAILATDTPLHPVSTSLEVGLQNMLGKLKSEQLQTNIKIDQQKKKLVAKINLVKQKRLKKKNKRAQQFEELKRGIKRRVPNQK